MSCCGNKRTAMKEARALPVNDQPNDLVAYKTTEHQPVVFEYNGDRNLQVQGVSTGKIYQFKTKGAKQEVSYSDSFAMMAEGDLRVSKL